jgi:hypothetical protein
MTNANIETIGFNINPGGYDFKTKKLTNIGVMVLARQDGRDNNFINQWTEQAVLNGMKISYYIVLEKYGDKVPFGTQISDFSKLIDGRHRDFPPGIVFTVNNIKNPHSFIGDTTSSGGFVEFLNKFPNTLIGSNKDGFETLFDNISIADQFFCNLMRDKAWMWYWLWEAGNVFPNTPTLMPWKQYKIWSSSSTKNLWYDDLCDFYNDNHLTKPKDLVCEEVVLSASSSPSPSPSAPIPPGTLEQRVTNLETLVVELGKVINNYLKQ